MKKKSVLNIIMVLVIVLIAVCGFLAIRALTGPGSSDGSALQISVRDTSGIVTVERNGIAYEVEKDAMVRAGDIFRTKTSAQLTLDGAMGTAVLGENTEMEVGEDALSLHTGEVFADGRSAEKTAILIESGTVTADKAVLTVTAQTGSQAIYVYSGLVTLSGEAITEPLTADAGECILCVENENGTIEAETTSFTAGALSDEQINNLQNCSMDDSFCFTEKELTKVLTLRQEEKEKAQQAQLLVGEQAKSELEQEQAALEGAQTTQPNSTTVISETPQGTTQSGSTQSGTQSNMQGATTPNSTQQNTTQGTTGGTTQSGSTSTGGSTGGTTTNQQKYVTIEIRCDTILNNMGNLTGGKEAYVPSNGVILSTSKIEFTEGETVFDVLQRACSRAGIQLEYRYTPLYGSYYIEGINQLYEFDCGDESGWMYKVNGWFPNYGCSSYTLKEGDVIVWCYTCNGLGADVGDTSFQ